MREPLVPLVAVIVLVAGCGGGGASEPRPPAAPQSAGRCEPALVHGLRAWAQAGFSGSISISASGKLQCAIAFGVAEKATGRLNTPKTAFSIGSISKAFTAAAVLDLVESGKLSLSDRAGDLLRTLGGPAADATVEQLLRHTSGLKGSHGNDHEPLGADQAIAAIGGLERAFPPGRRFLYSNAGYTLLALIVERVAGKSFRDYVVDHVLRLPAGRLAGGFWDGEPAVPGPRSIGYLEDGSAGERGDFAGPYWAVEGNGGLAMTMPQLAAWTYALFTARIVPRRVVDTIMTPGARIGRGRSETPGWVRYDRSVFGQPVFATAGGGGDVGHNAIVAWLPQQDRVIAAASNTAGVSAERLLEAIGPALAAGKPIPGPSRPARRPTPSELRAAAGDYALRGGDRFAVTVRGGRLAVTPEGPTALRAVFPLADGVSAGDVAGHERLVRSLLAGASEEGRKERAAIESTLGPIERTEVIGTIVHQGELRTYVTVTSAKTSLRLWYALNEEGGVKAAQGPADPPALALVGAGKREFMTDDPSGNAPRVIMRFAPGRMTVTSPAGRVTARRR
jgi:CubicO group peptidase (beta-lactamase class C family)